MSSIENLKIPDEKKRYINETLNPILSELVTDCLKSCPTDPPTFMIEWCQRRQAQGDADGSHGAGMAEVGEAGRLREEVRTLREENTKLKQTLGEATNALVDKQDKEDEEEDEEDDDDDMMLEIDETQIKYNKKARQSVSAEAYGAWNKKKEFVANVVPKTDEQKLRLKDCLSRSFMFNNLDERDFNVVIDAMEERIFDAGTQIIRQGDDGDYLFVIEEGKLECHKVIEGEDRVVKTCEVGDVFGELAVMYNTTRAANVRSVDRCVLWQLDRETFGSVVRDAAAKKREKYETFLKSVSLLKDMSGYELSQIADALQTEVFSDGQTVVMEGDAGDKFYLVENGNPVAIKNGNVVMNYQPGDYFGELSLIMSQPRQATINSVGACKLLSLDRRSFKRLLGPLDEIMKRQTLQKYGLAA